MGTTTISADDLICFTEGCCPQFAWELSRLTGWKMVALLHPTDDAFVSDYRRFLSGEKTRVVPAEDLRRMESLRSGPNRTFDFAGLSHAGLAGISSWSMYHVYCVTPDGQAADVGGIQAEEAFIARWARVTDPYEALSARQVMAPDDRTYLDAQEFFNGEQGEVARRAQDVIKAHGEIFGLRR